MAAETTIDTLAGSGIAPAVSEETKKPITLVAQLYRLDEFLRQAREYRLQHSLDEIIARKTEICWEFFQENPLAGRVLRGEDSYAQRVRPILERYGSFWNRYFTAQHEPEHDRYVQEVLASINGVGVHSLEVGPFITKNKYEDTLAMMGGGLVAGTTACAATLLIVPDLGFLRAAIVAVAVPFAAVGAMILPLLARNTIYRSHLLSQAAMQTDDYLAKIQLMNKDRL